MSVPPFVRQAKGGFVSPDPINLLTLPLRYGIIYIWENLTSLITVADITDPILQEQLICR